MTDFSQIFQMGVIQQPGTVLGSTAYVGGGYLPSTITTNPATSIFDITVGFTASFNSAGAMKFAISTTPTSVSITSGASSNGQQDVLLGTAASVTLVGDGVRIGFVIESPSGKKNKPDESW